MKIILEINDLSHSYGDEIFTIADFSFSLKEGEITSIIGASGIRKKTLLRIICFNYFFLKLFFPPQLLFLQD